jgi:hypothetical protein
MLKDLYVGIEAGQTDWAESTIVPTAVLIDYLRRDPDVDESKFFPKNYLQIAGTNRSHVSENIHLDRVEEFVREKPPAAFESAERWEFYGTDRYEE